MTKKNAKDTLAWRDKAVEDIEKLLPYINKKLNALRTCRAEGVEDEMWDIHIAMEEAAVSMKEIYKAVNAINQED